MQRERENIKQRKQKRDRENSGENNKMKVENLEKTRKFTSTYQKFICNTEYINKYAIYTYIYSI